MDASRISRHHVDVRALWLMLAIVIGCDQGVVGQAPVKPPAPPPAKRPDLVVREVPPPPPPPPPPRRSSPQPPPEQVASFLRTHESTPGRWRVKLRERARTIELSPARADELVARLGRDSSYVDGDYGCVGDEVAIQVARGDATLELIYDCGHVYLSEARHDGAWVLFSKEMVSYVESLRRGA